MSLELISSTIVLISSDLSPSMIHPDVLRSSGIVPRELKVVGDPICTSAFSWIAYNNGLSIQSEPNRFLVTDANLGPDPRGSTIPQHACAFVNCFPSLQHRAVGISFTGFIAEIQPSERLQRIFLSQGPWNDEASPILDFGLSLTLNSPPGVLRISLAAGEIQRDERGVATPAIMVQADYQQELADSSESAMAAQSALSLFSQRWIGLQQVVQRIFG